MATPLFKDFHRAWSSCVGLPDYVKAPWLALDAAVRAAERSRADEEDEWTVWEKIARLQRAQGGTTLFKDFHRAWTSCVGLPEYVKAPWLALDTAVSAAERSGVDEGTVRANIAALQQAQGGGGGGGRGNGGGG